MSPVLCLPEKRCSTIKLLVVIVDGIVCSAGPESCTTLPSNVASIGLVDDLVMWLPGISGSVWWLVVRLIVMLGMSGAGVALLMSSASVSSNVVKSKGL